MQHPRRFRPTECSCDRSATERGRVSGCRKGGRAGRTGGKKTPTASLFSLRKQLHSSAALAEGPKPRLAAAVRWLRGRLGGPKWPSKRGRGRGRRWPRHQLLLLDEGRVRVSPGKAEAEAEGRIPIPTRWQPDQNPALYRPAATLCRPVSFPELPELLIASFSCDRTGEAGRARPLGRRRRLQRGKKNLFP